MKVKEVKAETWMLEGEVGTSSKTIWAVMMGVITVPRRCDNRHYDTPHDPDDFKRCYKLLSLFPEWRKRLGEVGRIFPKWLPFVREWARMESLFIEEAPSGSCPKLYELMQSLAEEGMVLDGWVKTGASSWDRGE